MPFVTRRSLLTLSLLSGVAVLAVAGFIWSGLYNVGADDQHTRPVYLLMEALRERSIEARAKKLQVPDLKDPTRIAQGAGNYNAMCTGCHLTPGAADTELSKGLYPAPPNLTKRAVEAAEAFWVIKHGIKASGMPAWGKSMDDAYIWNMVAFLQELPKLDAARYKALVARSGGHSHGGGETAGHAHAEGAADDHGEGMSDDHAGMTNMPAGEAKPHSHAPGTPPHDDAPKASAPKPASTSSESKPHTHAPGTPPHDDVAPAKPATTQPQSEQMPSKPAPAEQDAHDDHDQH